MPAPCPDFIFRPGSGKQYLFNPLCDSPETCARGDLIHEYHEYQHRPKGHGLFFSLVHWTVKYMDWIYIPDLWHGKCLIFQIFGCPTCKLERILALTHHSTVMKIQGKHVFKHLTQCLALSINLCLALGINPALSINKYVIAVVISTSRFLLDSHLHGEQLAVRVVRFCPQAGSAPGAMKLPLYPPWVC